MTVKNSERREWHHSGPTDAQRVLVNIGSSPDEAVPLTWPPLAVALTRALKGGMGTRTGLT
jgi:hypothetical protein